MFSVAHAISFKIKPELHTPEKIPEPCESGNITINRSVYLSTRKK